MTKFKFRGHPPSRRLASRGKEQRKQSYHRKGEKSTEETIHRIYDEENKKSSKKATNL